VRTAILIYLIAVNVVAFILYGADKQKARKKKWRISEKALLGIAVIGGSPGAILGMFVFHHKTKHWYFRYGLPLILVIQILVVLFILKKIA
jgi:uncharacterized membrane protein YsdA (DUF1294 family)